MPRKRNRVDANDISRPTGCTRSGKEYKGASSKKVKFSNNTILTDALNKSVELAAQQAIELEERFKEEEGHMVVRLKDKSVIK